MIYGIYFEGRKNSYAYKKRNNNLEAIQTERVLYVVLEVMRIDIDDREQLIFWIGDNQQKILARQSIYI